MTQEKLIQMGIAALYDAVSEPDEWPKVLTLVADLLGAAGAQYFLWSKQPGGARFARVGRLPEEGNAVYMHYYGAIDPRRTVLERLPLGELLAFDEHFDNGGFRRSEFFNDFLIPYGLPIAAGSRV